jgi:antitoxin (DNA-binding transcriptional repressor) of toxin-antitoxin stability system
MRAVGLKTLKNKLGEYVRLAAGGETVLVTDRDRVVAEIVPPRPGRSPLLGDALLAEAVREGWVTPPLVAGGDPPPRKPIMALRDLMQELQSRRPVIYLDSSVALAHLLAEDRSPHGSNN